MLIELLEPRTQHDEFSMNTGRAAEKTPQDAGRRHVIYRHGYLEGLGILGILLSN
jgi:hypothetical protein